MTSRTIAFWTCAAVTFRGKKPKSGSLEAGFEPDGAAPLSVGYLCARYGLSRSSESAIAVEKKSKDKQSKARRVTCTALSELPLYTRMQVFTLHSCLPFVSSSLEIQLSFLSSPNLQSRPTTSTPSLSSPAS